MLRSEKINYKDILKLVMSDDFVENYAGYYLLNSMNELLPEEQEFGGKLGKCY